MLLNAFCRVLLAFGLTFLLLEPQVASAQANKKIKKETFWGKTQKYGFGLRAGPSISIPTITDFGQKDDFEPLPRTGYHIGGVVTMPLKLEYTFIAELGYDRVGRKWRSNETDWVYNYHYNLITASMALRRSVNDIFKKTLTEDLYFSIGPSVSYLAGGGGQLTTPNDATTSFRMKLTDQNPVMWDETANGDLSTYFINKPNRFLFGLDLGLGTDIPVTRNQTIYAEVRMNWGHTNLGTGETTSRFNLLNFEDTMRVSLKTISLTGIYTFTYETRRSKQGKSTLKSPTRKRRR
ncbi:MAG: outer membrane beta-barrel protein [Bacteroidota bacterium]